MHAHTHVQIQTGCIISPRENIYDEIPRVFVCILYTWDTSEKYLDIQYGKVKTSLDLVTAIFC